MPRLRMIDATHTHVFNCFHLLTVCQEPAIMACCWSHFIVIGSLSRIWLHTFLIHLNWRPCWVYHWKHQISEPQIPPHQTPLAQPLHCPFCPVELSLLPLIHWYHIPICIQYILYQSIYWLKPNLQLSNRDNLWDHLL